MSKNSTEVNVSTVSTSQDSCFSGKLRKEIELKISDLLEGETLILQLPKKEDGTFKYNINYIKRIVKEVCYKQNLKYNAEVKYNADVKNNAKVNYTMKGRPIPYGILFKRESINYQHAEVDIYAQLRAKGAPVPYQDYALAKICLRALRLPGQYCDVVVNNLFQFTQYVKLLTEEINRAGIDSISKGTVNDPVNRVLVDLQTIHVSPVFFGVLKLKDVAGVSNSYLVGLSATGVSNVPMRIKVRVQRN